MIGLPERGLEGSTFLVLVRVDGHQRVTAPRHHNHLRPRTLPRSTNQNLGVEHQRSCPSVGAAAASSSFIEDRLGPSSRWATSASGRAKLVSRAPC